MVSGVYVCAQTHRNVYIKSVWVLYINVPKAFWEKKKKKKGRFFKKYTEVKTVFTPGVSRTPRKARLESKSRSRGMTAGRAEIFLKYPQRNVISFEWGLMGK